MYFVERREVDGTEKEVGETDLILGKKSRGGVRFLSDPLFYLFVSLSSSLHFPSPSSIPQAPTSRPPLSRTVKLTKPNRNKGNDYNPPRPRLLLPSGLSPNLHRSFHHPLQRLTRPLNPKSLRRLWSNNLRLLMRCASLSLEYVGEYDPEHCGCVGDFEGR